MDKNADKDWAEKIIAKALAGFDSSELPKDIKEPTIIAIIVVDNLWRVKDKIPEDLVIRIGLMRAERIRSVYQSAYNYISKPDDERYLKEATEKLHAFLPSLLDIPPSLGLV